jgi:structure-specific recognition protein 1
MPPKKTPTKKAAAPKVAKKITKSPAAKAAKKVKVAKEDKPKRAPTAYLLFCKSQRAGIVDANPTFTFGEVGKELGSRWRGMSDAQKATFAAPSEQASG